VFPSAEGNSVSALGSRFACVGRLLAAGSVLFGASAAGGLELREIDSFPVPTQATKLLFSSEAGALILKNSGTAVVVIDVVTRQAATRFSDTKFTDIGLSPSGGYAFAVDSGSTNSIHRVDLFDGTWEVRRWDVPAGFLANHIQVVSDIQLILMPVGGGSFTNDAWGSGLSLIPLNTPASPTDPSYDAQVDEGDLRYDVLTGRLLHGNSFSSSQEIRAFRVVNNEFVRQERSGIYGSAQGYGGSVVLPADGSTFYYGQLQVDPLDVTHNIRVFPEKIYAASGRLALGKTGYYHPRTGALLGTMPFQTTVYAVNPQGDDFWAYDPLTTTVHHFVPAASFYTVNPCRLLDTRDTPGPFGGPALASGAERTFALAERCGIPPTATALAVNVTVTDATSGPGFLTIYPRATARPLSSTINYTAGNTRANNAIVLLGDGGDVVVYCAQADGTTEVVIDVTGYFQ
jgi:hypothetical protein